mmetsp:Transcript_22523/g.32905  ORF Transcript_22523/g.32905 Transcript_22523/m.32905 type:complete len:726 (+) Transcript_22523:104-2281(+)|eukprot:CAMPEP_0185028128 /NCGR_PEP_ID=MMETSP1103-20130426/13666_1 /TAXON_ID=36769 /ORGANISM="Paraphysomonas bandaiensis, Strain Caron Lab Isolate" /LENGTH=725 /DNA_ID=CAMNT_0027562427 /DNA_START=22 /DNA_END=2199 /DNA_ORIENTATION=-
MSLNIPVEKNRLALLQGRLGLQTQSQTLDQTQAQEQAQAQEQEGVMDATHEVVDICDESSEKSSSNKWDKELSREGSNSKIKFSSIEKEESQTGKKETTPKRQKLEQPDESNSRGASSAVGMRKIESYFAPNQGDGSTTSFQSSKLATKATVPGPSDRESTTPTYDKVSSSSVSFERSAVACGGAFNAVEWKKQNDLLKQAKEQAERKASRLEADLKSQMERYRELEDRSMKLSGALEEVYRLMAQQEMRRKRDRLAADCVRLGKIITIRTGVSVTDVWEEGYALKELNSRTAELSDRREELEKRRTRLKNLKKRHYASKKAQDSPEDEDAVVSTSDLDILTEENAVRMHMEQLRRDELALAEERRLLESEKAAHQKELKRCQSEDNSRFAKDLPCLRKRYVLLSMLGRGGFSEVWKALDLVKLDEVAIKVHQLNPSWSESRKQSYVKHVTREYMIHRELDHPRVVKLFDVFEIDVNSFATVLELCRGIDLDEKLKTMKTIPEKDAKTILMQIAAGLKYLNSPHNVSSNGSSNENDANNNTGVQNGQMRPPNTPRKRSIIHFDLKPANILFDTMGDVKITDFGLSKILEDADDHTSVELTSQGAGTYWYLPPECFGRGDSPPRISNKVDVWSLGVIFYQMLYGRRPFGEGKTQERVLSEGIMLNATQVDFPHENSCKSMGTSGNFQKVSEEAKDFIQTCLTSDQRYRPDVLRICQHSYLRPQKKS